MHGPYTQGATIATARSAETVSGVVPARRAGPSNRAAAVAVEIATTVVVDFKRAEREAIAEAGDHRRPRRARPGGRSRSGRRRERVRMDDERGAPPAADPGRSGGGRRVGGRAWVVDRRGARGGPRPGRLA